MDRLTSLDDEDIATAACRAKILYSLFVYYVTDLDKYHYYQLMFEITSL